MHVIILSWPLQGRRLTFVLGTRDATSTKKQFTALSAYLRQDGDELEISGYELLLRVTSKNKLQMRFAR